jgi:hypothetical protein
MPSLLLPTRLPLPALLSFQPPYPPGFQSSGSDSFNVTTEDHHPSEDSHGRSFKEKHLVDDDRTEDSRVRWDEGGDGAKYRPGVGYSSEKVSKKAEKIRKERMRRLETAFGKLDGEEHAEPTKEMLRAIQNERREMQVQEAGVDERGRLLAPGARWRAAARWLQGWLAFGAALGSIGTSVVSQNHVASDERSRTR